ncbi:methionine ABC transporter ATP-binding protein [Haloglycomyces albus]|uniref:methionine ABC transporter ATP-binding protein n=1 Tax=Haloglycomyces albus TaxID=526067 RepID=UPI00046D456F|nr:methionine ABC transporter ATP-binding protein [Haloglycomyces albus]
MITLTNVTKRFGDVTALDGIDLTIERGEVFGILGRSGAGKSTLLRCLNRLAVPDSGTIAVDGVDLAELKPRSLRRQRQSSAMIFQHFNLLSNRNAVSNVALPLRLNGTKRTERKKRALELLERVDLADKARAYPGQLSGGQRQRLAIARALATNPDVLLSDEATSALDTDTTDEILELLKQLNRDLGLTIVLITHELGVIAQICHRAAVMEEGAIIETGEVDRLLADPDTRLGSNARQAAARLLGETVQGVN